MSPQGVGGVGKNKEAHNKILRGTRRAKYDNSLRERREVYQNQERQRSKKPEGEKMRK